MGFVWDLCGFCVGLSIGWFWNSAEVVKIVVVAQVGGDGGRDVVCGDRDIFILCADSSC